MEATITVRREELLDFCTVALSQVGVPSDDARLVADVLVRADLRGTHSHGCTLLPLYVRRIVRGEIAPKASIVVRKDHHATMLIHGGNGLGQAVAATAMRLAMERAAQYGAAWVGVNGSHHFGMASYYAMLALERGMVGVVLTVSNINTMAPWGGRDVLIGNNPIAIAVPAGSEFPVVFDAALSVAARRKIHDAAAAGSPIPPGWALDQQGQPTIDPHEALAGLLVPIGQHKGYGLAFMMSLLAGALLGAHFGRAVSNTNVGHLVGALDVKAFCDPAEFRSAVDLAVHEVRNANRVPGVEALFVPGERGFRTEQERRANGIPLSVEVVETLQRLARELEIPELLG